MKIPHTVGPVSDLDLARPLPASVKKQVVIKEFAL